jgi:hypothetical protein
VGEAEENADGVWFCGCAIVCVRITGPTFLPHHQRLSGKHAIGLACLHLALASQPPLRSLNRYGPAALHRSFLSSFDYLLYPFRNFLQPL